MSVWDTAGDCPQTRPKRTMTAKLRGGRFERIARLPRYVLPSYGVYHVTARGVAKCDIFLDDDDRASFVGLLRSAGRRRRWKCHAYCLMGNHYHAIVETHLERLSSGLHRVNGTHAQRFNERYERVGHLFQDRFHARVLREEEHLTNACLYVWDNPVRIGLCAEAHEWPWSGRF